IKQTGASGLDQSRIAAASGRMRRVPRAAGLVVAGTHAIHVSDDGSAVAALRPVAACAVVTRRESRAVWSGASKYVVLVGRRRTVESHGDVIAFFGERCFPVNVAAHVQFLDRTRDGDTLDVVPRAFADPIAR